MYKLTILITFFFFVSCKKSTSDPEDKYLPAVTTNPMSTITQTTAFASATITNSGGDGITAKGFCWSTTHAPTLANTFTNEGNGTAGFSSELYGLNASTTYYARAYATNVYGTAYGSEVTFTTLPILPITIGTQQWMNDDLNPLTYRNGDVIPQVQDLTEWRNLTTGAWCYYAPPPGQKDFFHTKLYNWYAVNDPRGLLPPEWHMPTDAEWTTLITFLGGNAVAGGKMKMVSGFQFPNVGATSTNGFNGVGTGMRAENSNFLYLEEYGFWWSATESSVTDAKYISLYAGSTTVTRNPIHKRSGFAIRGIHD